MSLKDQRFLCSTDKLFTDKMNDNQNNIGLTTEI